MRLREKKRKTKQGEIERERAVIEREKKKKKKENRDKKRWKNYLQWMKLFTFCRETRFVFSFHGVFFRFLSDWGSLAFRSLQKDLKEVAGCSFLCAETKRGKRKTRWRVRLLRAHVACGACCWVNSPFWYWVNSVVIKFDPFTLLQNRSCD